MLRTKVWIWTLGFLFMQAFIVIVLRNSFVPVSPATRDVLQIFLPGFRWFSSWRFFIGLAESFLWGAYLAQVLVPMINVFILKHRHFAAPAAGQRLAA